MNKILVTAALAVCLIVSNTVLAHDHTHIGLNADGITGTGDDTSLWIFAEPQQPQWSTLYMTPTGDVINGKAVYEAQLDCWMSAHPASGLYQLGGSDSSTKPAWQIALERVSFSSLDFYMELEATGQAILTADGDRLILDALWMSDKYNENGTLGAWGFHTHTAFLVLADGPGQTFTAQFRAVDLGNTGFNASDVYTITFQTIPEPGSLMLLGLGAAAVLKRRSARE
ncbi:MAG TPA: PEP-CTERM sorting domain-containing protein [Anaerohalosphaeraceae bacterium]|nr:PEP-CTERM sorting domain-containing protein [Anaerohalosphaeraceae bacterium]